jgi:hypothetical protein
MTSAWEYITTEHLYCVRNYDAILYAVAERRQNRVDSQGEARLQLGYFSSGKRRESVDPRSAAADPRLHFAGRFVGPSRGAAGRRAMFAEACSGRASLDGDERRLGGGIGDRSRTVDRLLVSDA